MRAAKVKQLPEFFLGIYDSKLIQILRRNIEISFENYPPDLETIHICLGCLGTGFGICLEPLFQSLVVGFETSSTS